MPIYSAEQRVPEKSTLADAFAMALQCTGEGERPCGSCYSCQQAASGNHPEHHSSHTREAEQHRVEDVREQLVGDVQIRPYNGKYKIYIIPDAQMMTLQAQNAILKTIEEPPEYVVILLLTSNETQLLPTIHSRCVMLRFRPIDTEQLSRISDGASGDSGL